MTYEIATLNERILKGISNNDTVVHDYIIIRAMQLLDTPVTIDDLANFVTGYVTRDPLPKSIRWHLNKLVKEGVVKCTPVANLETAAA